MSSKYLNSLTDEKRKHLTQRLLESQECRCYICGKPVDLNLHSIDVDHIIPLANKGKDNEDNFAVTHDTCNRTKQDADLSTARILCYLKDIQEDTFHRERESASLKHVLELSFCKFEIHLKLRDNIDICIIN